jgi:hypothetical protein
MMNKKGHKIYTSDSNTNVLEAARNHAYVPNNGIKLHIPTLRDQVSIKGTSPNIKGMSKTSGYPKHINTINFSINASSTG